MKKKAEQEPKVIRTAHEETLGGAARSLIEAVAFMIILVLLVAAAVFASSYLSKNKDSAEQAIVSEAAGTKLPVDVPLYEGSLLTRYTHSGGTLIYEYDLPKGSVGSVQAFYKDQFKNTEWVRQPKSSTYVSEYKTNDRTLTITLAYKSGKVHMKIKIVKKKN